MIKFAIGFLRNSWAIAGTLIIFPPTNIFSYGINLFSPIPLASRELLCIRRFRVQVLYVRYIMPHYNSTVVARGDLQYAYKFNFQILRIPFIWFLSNRAFVLNLISKTFASAIFKRATVASSFGHIYATPLKLLANGDIFQFSCSSIFFSAGHVSHSLARHSSAIPSSICPVLETIIRICRLSSFRRNVKLTSKIELFNFPAKFFSEKNFKS